MYMPRSATKVVPALILFLVALVGAPHAEAASFTVSPTQVFLSAHATSALLTLRNDSDEPLRFQLTLFRWDQSPDGEMTLTPSEDIVYFPKLVALDKREERKVRIGLIGAFGDAERTYRIFVEELPPAVEPGAPTAGVRMRTRMGIPIFLEPLKATEASDVTGLTVDNGQVVLRVQNRGTIHFITDTVRVSGTSAQGTLIFNKVVNGWYILAGRSQIYKIPLSDAECQATATVSAEVKIGERTLQQKGVRPAAGCRPAGRQ